MPAAAGVATGNARIVHDPATARIELGDILVAATTDPGWTRLFLSAGGLVTETGSPIPHGPTVAREYRIPAVICVPTPPTDCTTARKSPSTAAPRPSNSRPLTSRRPGE
jgi:pyruvate,water dikinase